MRKHMIIIKIVYKMRKIIAIFNSCDFTKRTRKQEEQNKIIYIYIYMLVLRGVLRFLT